MLNLYRRHRAKCKRTARRSDCFCPIWVQGVLRGEAIRQTLDLTNWEAAQRQIQQWEIHGKENALSVSDACARWISDCDARGLRPQSVRKYREVSRELSEMFSQCSIRSVRTDDLRKLRESWSYSSSTVGKRLELVRAFFSFCEVSGWIEKNPAKGVKAPQARQSPTLPYSSQEWERILWALDSYGEIHPQSPVRVRQQLRALVLLMRFSGLRISDAVSLKSDGIDSFGNLFIYQAKTGHPVSIPLAHCVLEALDGLDSFPYFFWSGQGALKTALTEWQERLKKVFVLAGIPDGHGHRLRDTFAVELLQRGVSLQDVSILLGHRSIRTTEKHYSPWVKSRQDALEAAVKLTWQS